MADSKNTFSDVQAQMQSQMSSQTQTSGVQEAADQMAKSSEDMSRSSANSLQQTNALLQALQQTQSQIQTLSGNVQSLVNTQRSGMAQTTPATPSPAAVVAPQHHPGMMSQAGGFAKTGASMVGQMAMNKAEQAKQYAIATSNQYNPFSATAQHRSMGGISGLTPGNLSIQGQGLRSSSINAVGGMWNPTLAQSYNFGQYSHAQSRNVGQNVQDVFAGGAAGMANMASMKNAGSIGGGIAGGLIGAALGGPAAPLTGFIGSSIGSTVGGSAGGAADVFNPIHYGTQHMAQSAMYGSVANQTSGGFLRGGGGSRLGQFSLGQQARIGSSVSRTGLSDFTFTGEDKTQMQQMFAGKGLNLGVDNAQQYASNFKKRMQDAKEIMKIFNMNLEDATTFMSQEFGQMGFNSRSTRLRTEMMASAHLSGKSPQEIAQLAAGGAQSARQHGLMAQTGTGSALSSAGLAGMAAHSGNVGTNLLSTVGGEGGLQKILQNTQNQFMGGVGGTMMALGGGAFGTDVLGGLGRVSGGAANGGLVGFQANRHSMLNKAASNPDMIQAQQYAMLKGMAGQLSSAGGSESDRMKIMAQNQFGLDSAGADALISAGKSLPETLRRKTELQSQTRSDLVMDQFAEQKGIKGRVESAFRGFASDTGVLDAGDSIMFGAADIGESAQNKISDLTDRFYGAERNHYTQAGSDRLRKRVKGGSIRFGSGGSGKRSQQSKLASDLFSGKSGTSEDVLSLIRGEDGSTPASMRKLKRAAKTIREGTISTPGNNVTSVFSHDSTSDVTNQEVIDMLSSMPGGSGDQVEKFRANAGMPEELSSVDRKISKGDIAKHGRKLLGGKARKTDMDMATEEVVKFGIGAFLGSKIMGYDLGVGREIGQGVFSSIKDEDMNKALDTPSFKDALRAINIAFKEYKPNRKDNANNKKYQRAMKQFKMLYNKLSKNPKVKEVLDKVLRERGLSLTDEGAINIEKFKRDPDNASVTGAFFNDLEENFSRAETDIDQKRAQESYGDAAANLGLKGSDGKNLRMSDAEGLMDSLGAAGSLESNKKRFIEMSKSTDANDRAIGSAALLLGRGEKLSDNEVLNTQKAVLSKGMNQSQGDSVGGTGSLDPKLMGAETIKGLANVNQGLNETYNLLKLLHKSVAAN